MVEENSLPQLKEIQQLMDQLNIFEQEIMVQIDGLATKMPELYGEYARLVRQTFDAAIDIFRISPEKSEKIGKVVEVLARGIEAYGEYKRAKEHNEMLAKYMQIKKNYAALNKAKIQKLHEKINKTISSSERIFEKYAFTQFNLSGKTDSLITRQGVVNLKVLTLFRTHCFVLFLCEYLDTEYKAWERGEQTSEELQPNYYDVNSYIIEKLYGSGDVDFAFARLEEICDKKDNLSGADMMMLADPQLLFYCLQDELCEINLSASSQAVRALLENNPSLHQYTKMAVGMHKHARRNPAKSIWITCGIGAFFISIIILSGYPSGVSKWIFLILGLVATFRIGKSNAMKAKINHVFAGEEKAKEFIGNAMQSCGYVETEEIDYEEKDTTMALIKGFFKI